MEAYLDNSATTPCYQEVCDIVVKTMMEDYGNPSAMHLKGVEAEKYIKEAAAKIAKTLKVDEKEIYFTSGGTESDNWALFGTAMANHRRGKHIIISSLEHKAVAAPAEVLEKQGFTVTRLKADEYGQISLEELEQAITPETILVSIMHVNNEVGSVQPLEEIGAVIKNKNPQTYFHVDAVQGYGKYRIFPRKWKIDMLSVSGHKIHGPKGTGFLYIGDKVKINPFIYGGGQQKGMRSGTDAVPGVAGLGVAAEKIYSNLEESVAKMRELRTYFIEELGRLEDVVVHGMEDGKGAPHIVSASFLGVRSEVLLHTLEDRQIYISAGSACSSHKKSGSPTLLAMNLSQEERESVVRFSFSELTTKEELEYTINTLAEVLPMLRKYTRK